MRSHLLLAAVLIGLCPVAVNAKPTDPQEPDVVLIFRKALEAKVSVGKIDDAIKVFRDALQSAKTGTEKKAVREDFLRIMARAGKPLEAYRAFPGGKESFNILAEQLVASGHSAALGAVIEEHSGNTENDPNLGEYRGQADAQWKSAFN